MSKNIIIMNILLKYATINYWIDVESASIPSHGDSSGGHYKP